MLTTLDIILIVIYILATVAVGIACRGKQEDVNDYFTSGGGMTGAFGVLLVGLSLAATLFSGISFLAIPSLAYSEGTKVYFNIIALPLAWPILRYFFLPRYLDKGYTQPYEVLEKSFGLSVRLAAAFMFVLLRIGWMSTLIYAPTLALIGACGLGDEWFWPLALIIGGTCTIYTALGGIRGVIITDAIQFVVIFGGIVFAVVFAVINLPGNTTELTHTLREEHLLTMPSLAWDWKDTLTIWSILLGLSVASLGNYVGDQMALQRYLSTGTVKGSIRSFSISVIGAVVILAMLITLGIAISLWYDYHPEVILPERRDMIFPFFIASVLPNGISGLMLAAILAATMSSMTSGVNALAGTITFDFRERFVKIRSKETELKFARWTSVAVGIIATVISGFVGLLGSIFDITQIITGAFLGPLIACLMYAVYKVSIRPAFVLAGIGGGVVTGWWIALGTDISRLWVAPASLLVCVACCQLGAFLGDRKST